MKYTLIVFSTLFMIISSTTITPYATARVIDGLNTMYSRIYPPYPYFPCFSNKTLVKTAIILFSLALVCYSAGVISELMIGVLKPWHVRLFWLGFLFEVIGAIIMFILGRGELYPIHMLVGGIALALIIIHNILASIVIKTGITTLAAIFPKVSLSIYIVWLIAFVTGVIIGMKQPKQVDIVSFLPHNEHLCGEIN